MGHQTVEQDERRTQKDVDELEMMQNDAYQAVVRQPEETETYELM